jgi:DNA polymerase III alpha subunit
MKFTSIEDSQKPFEGWLHERYGDCYAQICVMTTLRVKNACKDVARALLGHVPQDIEDWCKRFEMPPQGVEDLKFVLGYTNDEGHQPGSIERDPALQAYVEKYPEHWEIVKNALALPRQRGRHASAFIVASEPIANFIPIVSVSGIKVTAFSGPEVETIGGLKMDWLVVDALSHIQDCLVLIRGNKKYSDIMIEGKKVPSHRLVKTPTGDLVDIWDLPEDQEVFTDISKGKTESVFQFSTHAALQWLKHFDYVRPDGTPGINSIMAMAIFTALDRPGPLDYCVTNPDNGTKHNIMVEYARRVRGLNGSPDILSAFDKMLPKTNSLMVFQEDLQRVFQELTGCTGSEAEEFRSNIAKKKKEKVDKAYKFFMERVTPKLGEDQAQKIWDSLKTFSQYGFNAAHATAYVCISYACAWLKHYYPLQWWCSVLKNSTKEKVSEKYWQHVKGLVDLPDLNLSQKNWSICGGRVRAPIDLCYGVGDTAHKQLVAGAPYSSVEDFCKKIIEHKVSTGRSAIHSGTIYALVASGVMDSLFEEDTTIANRIDLCNRWLKHYTIENGMKYSKPKEKNITPDAIGRFQIKKGILPVYSEDLRQYLHETPSVEPGTPPMILLQNGMPYYQHLEWSSLSRTEETVQDRIVGQEEMAEMDIATELPQGGFRCAIVGYIEDVESFSYKSQGQTRTAKKFLLDVGGFKQQMVYWPDRNGSFPRQVIDSKKGTVVLAILSKTDLNRGFNIRNMSIYRLPYSATDKAIDQSTE